MRLLTCLTLVFLVVVTGVTFASEWTTMRTVAELERRGDLAGAERALDGLANGGTIFLRPHALQARREQIHHGRLMAAVAAHDFREAVRRINLIVDNDVHSGVEGAALDFAAALPERHLQRVAQLLRAGEPTAAIDDAGALRAMYPGHASVLARSEEIEADARVQLARDRLANGDPMSTLRELGRLDTGAPVRAQAGAVALAERALAAAAEHYLGLADYPGFYRCLARAQDEVQKHPYLVRQVEQFRLVHTERLFEVALVALAAHGEQLSMPVQIAVSLVPGEASLVVHNATARPIVSTIIGPERHKGTIQPRGRLEVKATAGEYVQLVHLPGAKDVKAHLGIITVRNKVEQRFHVRAPEDAGRERG